MQCRAPFYHLSVPTHIRDAGAPRISELDGIRGMACLLVVIWHYICASIPPGLGNSWRVLHSITALTWSGVDLFFVLSGFLLGGILLDLRSAPHFFRAFYTRRLFRILPLYYVIIFVFVLLQDRIPSLTVVHRWLVADPFSISSYAGFFQNFLMAQSKSFGPKWLSMTWSLAIEEQFYLILPLIIRFTPSRMLFKILLVLALSAPVFRILTLHFSGAPNLTQYVLLPARWDSLFIGVLGAWFTRKPGVLAHTDVASRRLLVTFGILGLGVVILGILSPHPFSFAMASVGYSWIACFYLSLILIALKSPAIGRIFRMRGLTALGTISYGVYLLHLGVAGLWHWIIREDQPTIRGVKDLPIVIGALFLTLALATLSFRFFERPLVELGRRLKWGSYE